MTRNEIIDRLYRIESEHRVRILLAVESGSRAWGFASPDSDWDVRFIYVHPVEWYLTVEPGPDVIEVMDGDFDAAGWLVSATVSDPAILASIEQLLTRKSRSHEHDQDQDSVPPLLTDYASALSSRIPTLLGTHHPTPPRNADPQLDHLLYTLASGTHTAGTY